MSSILVHVALRNLVRGEHVVVGQVDKEGVVVARLHVLADQLLRPFRVDLRVVPALQIPPEPVHKLALLAPGVLAQVKPVVPQVGEVVLPAQVEA